MVDKVSAVILLRHDGAALLQHRDNKPNLRHAGMWVPPGGHAEPGESMLECARRELREETEYDSLSLKFLLSFDDTVPGWLPCQLSFFWDWYDGVQSLVCYEGQQLSFIERSLASHYSIPDYLVKVWDKALVVAGLSSENPMCHAREGWHSGVVIKNLGMRFTPQARSHMQLRPLATNSR